MSDLLMGVDLGAGGVKVSVIDPAGTTLAEASSPVETSMPRLGWAEQDPEDWWRAACVAIRSALGSLDGEPSCIAALSVSGGAHIGVLSGDDGVPLRPAILWSDSRSAAEAGELRDRADARIIELSLNRANPTWLLPQLLWINRNDPGAAAAASRLFLSKDWLRFRLCGTWCTDFSDAVGALLADSRSGGWSSELCALAGWNPATLPPIVDATAVVGEVTAAAAAASGLVAGTPVVCGSNDTTVELFGAGAIAPGDGAVKLATAGVVSQVTDGPLVRPPVSCYPSVVPGRYYTATGINSCASAHRWVRDRFFAAEGFAGMDQMASTVAPGSEGLIFHPYLQGERAPLWDPELRADFVGLTMQHDRPHIARAVYEGIAFAICDAMTVAEGLGMRYDTVRLIGGGARSATWRQIMADVLGRPVVLPANGDASFGAAVVAGLGIGTFSDPADAVARCCSIVAEHEPDDATRLRYAELFAVYRDVQQCMVEPNHRLHRLTAGS